MADAPKIVYGSDNTTPTVMEQQEDGGWAQPVAAKDGYIATLGKKTDGAVTDPTAEASGIALLKGALQRFQETQEKHQIAIDRLAAIVEKLAGTLQVAGTVTAVQGTPGADTAPWPVKLTGSYASLSAAPVVGSKTVTTTAAEIFAGASRLANRYSMAIHNESTVIVYWGPSGVTTSNGFPILPGDSIVLGFKREVATPIYCIAPSNAIVRVVELA